MPARKPHLPGSNKPANVIELRPQKTLLAAAQRLTHKKIRTISADFEDEAWQMYRNTGELRYVADTFAKTLSRASLRVVETLDDGTMQTVESGPAADILRALLPDRASEAAFLQRLALHLYVAGSSLVVGVPDEDIIGEPGLDDLRFHPLSGKEVSQRGSKVTLTLGTDKREMQENDSFSFRVWSPDAAEWWRASSPVRGVLDVLREIHALDGHVQAQIDSRLAGAGILIVTTSAMAKGAEGGPVEDGLEAYDTDLTDALMEAMLTPLEPNGRGSASAVVPLILEVPTSEDAAAIRHITFATPFDASTAELRRDAIRRLALGLDAPPSQLLGDEGGSQWGAWLTSHEFITQQVEPGLALISDGITTGFLHPALEEAGETDPGRFSVWFDTSSLTRRPNRTDEALILHERGILSDEALVRVAGFDSTDVAEKIGEEAVDPAVEAVLDLVRAAPSLAQDPGMPALLGQVRALLSGQDASEVDPADVVEPEAPTSEQPSVQDGVPATADDAAAGPTTSAPEA